jgi:hypothetical protein
MKDKLKKWAIAAAVRAIQAAANAALGVIGATAYMGGVDWGLCGSAALLAAISAFLLCVKGLPEVEGGASVRTLAKKDAER